MTQNKFIIEPRGRVFDLHLKEIWRYRDLLMMFIRRDIVTFYKQTILGPVWFFIQPILTTIMFMFVFGRLAGISTDGIPQPLFYLGGITLWNYFADSLTKTSDTFLTNQHIFGKVYFPRLIVPLSITLTGLIKMGIQFILFILVYAYFVIFKDFRPDLPAPYLLPLYLFTLLPILAALGLGFGIIISSLTTKYRDLRFLITFGIQLWMYATPVAYPLSEVEKKFEKISWLIQANPLTGVMETFKYGFLGEGHFTWGSLAYSAGFALLVLLIGSLVFNRVERSFIDVI